MILPAAEARAVAGARKTAHAIPFREDPTMARRFTVGNSLPVQPQGRREGRAVALPALCRVVLRDVSFMVLGDIGFDEARAMGYRTTDEFRVAWVERWDAGWCERRAGLPVVLVEDDILARFARNHVGRTVWLLRFELDKTHRPRLLAARSDELYTDNPARALDAEAEAVDALTLEEYAKANGDRHAARRAGVADELLSAHAGAEARLGAMRRLARERGVDVRDDLRTVERAIERMAKRINDQRKAA